MDTEDLEIIRQREEMHRVRCELEAAQRLNKELYDHAPVGYLTVDATDRIRQANLTACALFGVDRETLLTRTFSHMVGESFQAMYAAQRHQTTNKNAAPACDLQLTREDGSALWVALSASPEVVPQDAGLLRLTLTDITLRKQAELAHLRSEETYRTLVEWSPEAINVYQDGVFVYLNPTALQAVGAQSQQELLGTRVLDRVHPDYHAMALARAKSVTQLGQSAPTVEMVFLKLDGTPIEVETRATSVMFNGMPAACVAWRDITQRKANDRELTQHRQAMEATLEDLRAAKIRLQLIADSVPAMIAYFEYPSLICSFANRQYAEFFGWTPSTILGKPAIEAIGLTAYTAILPHIEEAKKGNPVHYERLVDLPNGDVRAIQVAMLPHLTDSGLRPGTFILLTEITNYWKVNKSLESALKDLRATQAQLIQSEKMAALGQLVASVAHEINTPLSAIKSSGQSITDELDHVLTHVPRLFELLPPDLRTLFGKLITQSGGRAGLLSTREEREIVRDTATRLARAGIVDARAQAAVLVQLNAHADVETYLPLLQHADSSFVLETAREVASVIGCSANINSAVERVNKIVFALKSFSRSDSSGQMILSDLQDGMETVLTIYRNQIKHGIDLVCSFDVIEPVMCLPDELNQVWTNLIQNALQAMGLSGTLSVSIGRTGDEAVVRIGDSGSGIAEAIRNRIFEAFFTTKPIGEGSGLGLHITKQIIDKHHGRIEVQSEVDVGTTFSVFLPYTNTTTATTGAN